MDTNAITVVYKWTAKPGQLDVLKGIYDGVTDAMQANEPGALEVQIYVSEDENALYVRDVFADAGALGFHLSETAGPHFPSLLEVATPGAFLFFGDVPAEMQQAAKAMGLAAEFACHRVGFNR
ncbi:putative quinol monooxygenase [Silicimonas sp. MF1-12-2]|uniref:putative quinol monooxygenase n=1 Tax=Silicimonas sp. MF1-12-2 TaxID=3384793 RepID=UPI0039B6107C